MHKGKCPICEIPGSDLIEYSVVEVVVENGVVPKIALCDSCRTKHERYRNHLRDNCDINIDKTKKS